MNVIGMQLKGFEEGVDRRANRTVIALYETKTLELNWWRRGNNWPVLAESLCDHSLIDNLHINTGLEGLVLLAYMRRYFGRANNSLAGQANKGLKTTIYLKTP